MEQLNTGVLADRLLAASKPFELVNYIFRSQGAQWQHLNFRTAAAELRIDKNTVARYVRDLVAKGVLEERLTLYRIYELRIAEDLIAPGEGP